jgi:hypothetical protein
VISLKDYWMGRDIDYACELGDDIRDAATETVRRVNLLLARYADDTNIVLTRVTSGWRPPSVNASAGGVAKSRHMTGHAVDIADVSGKFKEWLARNPQPLADCNLYMEHPGATPTWCHLQSLPPRSGKRVFLP